MFRIIGEIKRAEITMPFNLHVRDVTEENALEQIYCNLGSRHKAKRFQIKIKEVKEVPLEN
jgi:ribosomal protein L20A (L18A)